MKTILFDDPQLVKQLLPLTYTRPISEIRFGIMTLTEKWSKALNQTVSWLTSDHLSRKYSADYGSDNLYVNGSVCPNPKLIAALSDLEENTILVAKGKWIAFRSKQNFESVEDLYQIDGKFHEWEDELLDINATWEIFQKNGAALETDFETITAGRTSQSISATNTVLGDKVFIEEGAKVECAILNSTTGPIYIGKGAEVMEGSIIRGGFALCDHSTVKLGGKIYGPTTIGPHSKVGGEISNSVIIGYSNKGHDGFMGNSVLGEWCNLGADTNTSNLKNNYGPVKVWSYSENQLVNTGLQFCGLLMGDHSKSGINTMFNTGTVVGVCANVFGGGFPQKFIPSYSWGGADGFTEFRLEKAFEVADRMMQRRKVAFDENEKAILTKIFDTSASFRK